MRIKRMALLALVAILAFASTASASSVETASHPDRDRHGHDGDPSLAPGHRHGEGPAPVVDWSGYPADIQALKAELDRIRGEQKSLFEKMNANRDQIREARKALSTDQRSTLKKPALKLIEKMKANREDIHDLRGKKREAWESFHEHAGYKQWAEAKSDLEGIVKQKKQILAYQKEIVGLQGQLLKLIGPSSQSNVNAKK
ncbi:hypothetical protein ACFPPD_13665 [Cohnella suwonensis]|uniref:Periplasmic heavy metal sensor n=1 Tax=Cohnella suwonensis TaxID=696072 RepID=A0ABW0LYG8_9BACL